MRAALFLGRTQEALAAVQSRGRVGSTGSEALCLAALDRKPEAANALRETLLERHVAPPEEDGSTQMLVQLLEASLLLSDRDAVVLLARRVAPAAPMSLLVVTGNSALTTPARHLGAAAALLDKPQEARAYYLQALEAAGKIRFRPEIALTHLGLVELLLDEARKSEPLDLRTSQSPDLSGAALSSAMRKEANEHLDLAIAEFQAMKMTPSVEKALALRERLQG